MPYVNDGDRREYQREYYRKYRARRRQEATWRMVCDADDGKLRAIDGIMECGTPTEMRIALKAALKTIDELNDTIDDLKCDLAELQHELKNVHR